MASSRSSFYGLIIALILAGNAALAQAADWQKVSPPDTGLVIEMPGEPKASNQKIDTVAGEIEVTLYILEVDGLAYLVNSTSIPPNAPKATIEERLNGARDGAVQNTKGKLVSEKKIKVGVNQGRDLIIEKEEDGIFIHARIVMVGRKLVQALAVNKNKEPNADTTRFLSSLQIVKDE